jgi:ribonuclease E
MPNKMLIDASHPEETRVVVVRGNRIEEFDFESQDKKQLKGNIYLARVTRVEPSLQAAFVEYGGNRHGFLAFSEIHPDYYQIPVADRQALLRAEAEAAEAEDDEDGDADERGDRSRGRRRRRSGKHRGRDERRPAASAAEASEIADDDASHVHGDHHDYGEEGGGADSEALVAEHGASDGEENEHAESDGDESASDDRRQRDLEDGDSSAADTENTEHATERGEPRSSIAASIEGDVISEPIAETTVTENDRGGVVEEVHSIHADDHEVESVGAEDALEEIRSRRKPVRRNYKIQEVIKRRQILLVQVVKEERGNKGAALTTYLSLAGRYSVLMPNTARGGGISRKITNAQDRKRLKEVVQDLDVPQGMGVILRTAGESRTKAEIKRDYEYLMRLWETVRNLTLQSTAPALVYEEGSLIKRSVRDLYNKDIDEVLVAGEDGYREAKDFMRMLMPSHAKVVQPFRDTVPIFARNGIEAQLDKMLQPQVTLKSGGYIIINQTEALVSIDVNSGRSTKEHSIEDTALQTNLEASEEVSRQLRLRDLAGLIVIDFIDMEENRNNRAVEKRLKDCLKNDRARIQVGRISHFGLLEMSRQRIRASVLESTMKPCPHCGGAGHVRSDSSVALHVVRAIEEFLLKDSRSHITVKTPAANALYVLNHKRSTLVELERRFGVVITLEADETLGAQHYAILRGAIAEKPAGMPDPLAALPSYPEPEADIEVEIDEEEAVVAQPAERPAHADHDGHADHNRDRKRRRRRRRRGGRDRDREPGAPLEAGVAAGHAAAPADQAGYDDDDRFEDDGVEARAEQPDEAAAEADGDRKKRRRGKRGGKRNRPLDAGSEDVAAGDAIPSDDDTVDVEAVAASVAEVDTPVAELQSQAAPAAKPKRAPRKPKKTAEAPAETLPEAVAELAAKAAAPAEVETVAEAPAAEAPAPADPVTETVAANDDTPAADADELRASRRRPTSENAQPAQPVVVSTTGPVDDSKPKKAGWWQRKGFF